MMWLLAAGAWCGATLLVWAMCRAAALADRAAEQRRAVARGDDLVAIAREVGILQDAPEEVVAAVRARMRSEMIAQAADQRLVGRGEHDFAAWSREVAQ